MSDLNAPRDVEPEDTVGGLETDGHLEDDTGAPVDAGDEGTPLGADDPVGHANAIAPPG